MDIKPVDKTVKQLLEGDFYKIPRFQRPYSWDRDNVEEFWNDAVVADVDDYFIGSFVVHRSSDQYAPLYVVDGQQRLTTITILLAAVRDAMDEAELPSLAKGVQRLIERQDMNDDLKFVLQTETSYPYLQEHIQKHGKPAVPAQLGEEEEALKAAYDFLKGQIDAEMESIDSSSSRSKEQTKKKKLIYLQRVRDRVLRLQLILIRLTKEDEAYLIFETLNTRGKDLTVADLVKNHVTRLMKPRNKGVDIATDKWKELLEVFEKSKVDLDVNRYLHHAWLSRHQYIGEKQLFAEIKKAISAANVEAFLEQLLKDAAVYRTVFDPDWRPWGKHESDVVDALKGLQVFRVVQPAPMLLAILRAHFGVDLTLKQVRTVLHTMENFHFKFTAMTAGRTGGGTGKMYAASGRALTDASSKDRRALVLKEFVAKLRERVPSEPEVVAGFERLMFSAENSKQKTLVRYTLMRIDAHLRKTGGPPNYERMSIEHIASQSPPPNTPAVARLAEIGNLILVPEKLNSETLRNKAFLEKKALLKQHGVPMDDVLEDAKSWGDAEIQERTLKLATMAYQDIFVV